MATVLVNEVVGTAWIRNADGSLTQIQSGMRIPEDANIVTEDGSRVELAADGVPALILGEGRDLALSPDMFNPNVDAFGAAIDPSQAVDPAIAQILANLEEGGDILEGLDATAAVLTAGGGEGGGSSFTRLLSIVETTTPLALAYPRPVVDTPEAQILGGTGADTAPAAAPTVPGEVDLEAPVVEPTPIPVEPETPIDETTPPPVDPETPVDPEVPVAPEPETPTGPTIPARPAIVTLTAPEFMTEGEPYTIIAEVDLPVIGSDLIITLDNGQTITIPVGETTGEVTVASPRIDDVYIQGDKPSAVGITEAVGGGYTSINTDSTATTTIKDDTDPTQVTLTSSEEVTEGGPIRVDATVASPVTDFDLVITLNNGETITIPVGEITGSVEFVSREDDNLVQGDGEKSVSITEITGGNYEKIAYSTDPVTTKILDNDKTEITVGNPSVAEGEVAVFDVDFGKPVDNETTITFKLQYGGELGDADISDIDTDTVEPLVSITGTSVDIINNNDGTYSFKLPAEIYENITIAIQTKTDNVFEGNEFFTLVVEQAGKTTNGTEVKATGEGIGEIVDSKAPEVRIESISVTEGVNEYAVFTVGLDKTSFEDISFDFGLVRDTAQPTQDYEGLEISLDGTTWVSASVGTIAAGSQELYVRTKIVDDNVQEGEERLGLAATVTSGKVVNKVAGATATILDDDMLVLTVLGSEVKEGELAEFIVNLNKAVEVDTTMTLSLGHGDTSKDDFDFELPIVKFGEIAVDVTKDPDGTYSFTVPKGDSGNFSVQLQTKEDGVFEGSEGFTLKAELSGILSDGSGIKGELTATGKGTITDTNIAPTIDPSGEAEGDEDNDITVTLSATDSDGEINFFTINSLPENGVLWFDDKEVKEQTVITAVNGSAKLTFIPKGDWSGETNFSYTATDNGGEIVTADYTINVKAVTDEPIVSILIGKATDAPQKVNVGTMNVEKEDPSHTVKAFFIDSSGERVEGTISIVNYEEGLGVGSDKVNGFGVSGQHYTGGSAADREIDKNEIVRIDFENEISYLEVSFAWLREESKDKGPQEYAKYTLYDKAGEPIRSGYYGGTNDEIEAPLVITDEKNKIASVEFTAPAKGIYTDNNGKKVTIPDDGSDFVIHQIGYKQVGYETYPLTLVASPGDIDGSEQITSVVVKVPAGAEMSHGVHTDTDEDGVKHYELSLENNQGYRVTSLDDGKNGIKIEGVTVTVPKGSELKVEVEATAQEGQMVDGVFVPADGTQPESAIAFDLASALAVSGVEFELYEKNIGIEGNSKQAGTVEIKSSEEIDTIKIGGSLFNLADLQAATDDQPLSIETAEGKLFITGLSGGENGVYQLGIGYELEAVVKHGAVGSETDNKVALDAIGIEVTNVHGRTESSGVKLTVFDDKPTELTLEKGLIVESYEGNIDFKAGADGSGGVTFNVIDNAPVLDTSKNPVQMNGENLFYKLQENGTLAAETVAGAVAFNVTIDGDKYIVSDVAADLRSPEKTEKDIKFGQSGGTNSETMKTFSALDNEGSRLEVTANAGARVNGSSPGGFALGSQSPGNGNSINANNHLIFEFLEENDSPSKVKEASLTFTNVKVQGKGQIANIRLRLFDSDGNELQGDHSVTAGENTVTYRDGGWVFSLAHDPSANVGITLQSDEAFSKIVFSALEDGTNYRIRVPSPITKEVEAEVKEAVELDIPVLGMDKDGDSIDGTLALTLDHAQIAEGEDSTPQTQGLEMFSFASLVMKDSSHEASQIADDKEAVDLAVTNTESQVATVASFETDPEDSIQSTELAPENTDDDSLLWIDEGDLFVDGESNDVAATSRTTNAEDNAPFNAGKIEVSSMGMETVLIETTANGDVGDLLKFLPDNDKSSASTSDTADTVVSKDNRETDANKTKSTSDFESGGVSSMQIEIAQSMVDQGKGSGDVI